MYSLDLKQISLNTFKELLSNKNLLPGRKLLHQNLDVRFSQIASQGIGNLSELKKSLSSPDKLRAFSSASNVPEDYLILLKREAGSLEQKPLPLTSFLLIDAKTAGLLYSAGIKTSRDYYEFYSASPNEAAQKVGASKVLAEELFRLTDLVRINGVGAAAAQTFFEAGYNSTSKVAQASAREMLDEVTRINNIKNYYNAKLGLKDMQFCIDFAKTLLAFSIK